MKEENNYEKFGPLSKKKWLEEVQRTLKGADYESLHWKINERIILEPYYTRDEAAEQVGILARENKQANWYIGVELNAAEDLIGVDERLKFALNHGAEVIKIVADDLTVANLDDWFNGVCMNMITVFIETTHFQEEIHEWLIRQNPSKLLPHRYIWKHGNDMLNLEVGDENLDKEMAHMFAGVLDVWTKPKISERQTTYDRLAIDIKVGPTYFLEIARCRALRLFLLNLSVALEHPGIQATCICAKPVITDQGDVLQNLIEATTNCLSAVQGGADVVFIPELGNIRDWKSNMRMALNIQHVFKMEGNLNWVADPLAGSYFIEEATAKIAESAWRLFQERV